MTELSEIIELDAAIPAENLQFSPEVYTHRRFLLEHIRQRDEDVKELGELMGLEGSLADIIVTVRHMRTVSPEGTKSDTVERELHSPFHQTAQIESWFCGKSQPHPIGSPCSCDL